MHLAYIWIVSHLSVQNYQNRWKFDEVLTKTNLLSFFWDTVYSGAAYRRRAVFPAAIIQAPLPLATQHPGVRTCRRDAKSELSYAV